MNIISVTDLDGTEIDRECELLIKDVCNLICSKEVYGRPQEINVYMVSDDEIRKMNREKRGVDKPTDVLSFPMGVYDPENGCDLLGEIVISSDMAGKQAKMLGHSYERELAFLCMHGMLHLFGYDHEDASGEEEMTARQKEIIREISERILDKDKDAEKYVMRAARLLKKAYAPYSKFRVSCIAVAYDGTCHEGINVENISYGATSCAERNAICSAVAKGKKDFIMMIIASDMDGYIYPCGICRQVMAEFLSPWTKIIVSAKDRSYKEYRIYEIMPHSFEGPLSREGS